MYLPLMMAFDQKLGTNLSALSSGLLIAVNVLFGIIVWILASVLSSQVTKGHDTTLGFTSLTKEDLYRFAFVFLGLFFVLSALSVVIQTGYKFFAYDLPLPDSNPQKGQFLWPFIGHAVTVGAGLGCMLGARRWTAKLIRWELGNVSCSLENFISR